MVDVYQNCYISIAATGASHGDQGLFARRDPLIYQPCQLTKGSEPPLFAIPHRYPQKDFKGCFTESPLHNRAWVLQERILAPRTLNFGILIVWECREHYRDEFSLSLRIGRTLKGDFASSILQPKVPRRLKSHETLEIRKLWCKILLAYTKANLTAKSDMLIALSGITNAIERFTGWRNIAGLWEPFLIEDLLWKIEDMPWTLTPFAERAPGLPGPSWSWVSVDRCTITYESAPFSSCVTRLLACAEGSKEVDYGQSTDGGVPEGQATIRISAPLVKTTHLGRNDGSGICHTLEYAQLADWPGVIVRYRSDRSSSFKCPHVFMPLAHKKFSKTGSLFTAGLLLAPSGIRPGAYERLGRGTIQDPEKHAPFLLSIFSEPTRRQIITLV